VAVAVVACWHGMAWHRTLAQTRPTKKRKRKSNKLFKNLKTILFFECGVENKFLLQLKLKITVIFNVEAETK
jgi:hypothetical protein